MSQAAIPERLVLLMADFAASVGIPEMAFDERGFARLRLGESLDIVMSAAPPGLTLSADLGFLPADKGLDRRALAASFLRDGSGESWLALDPDSHLHLFNRLPAEGLDVATLEAALVALMQGAVEWRALLAADTPAAEASPAVAGNIDFA